MDEIEVTPEMMAAGQKAARDCDPTAYDEIYRAMRALERPSPNELLQNLPLTATLVERERCAKLFERFALEVAAAVRRDPGEGR